MVVRSILQHKRASDTVLVVKVYLLYYQYLLFMQNIRLCTSKYTSIRDIQDRYFCNLGSIRWIVQSLALSALVIALFPPTNVVMPPSSSSSPGASGFSIDQTGVFVSFRLPLLLSPWASSPPLVLPPAFLLPIQPSLPFPRELSRGGTKWERTPE